MHGVRHVNNDVNKPKMVSGSAKLWHIFGQLPCVAFAMISRRNSIWVVTLDFSPELIKALPRHLLSPEVPE